jgi:predicted lipoprotein
MNCTLSDLHGAKYTQTPVVENAAKESNKKKPNEDVCAVWDIDAGAWRSFRWDRLIRIDYKLG